MAQLNPVLAELLGQFRAAELQAKQSLSGLSDEQMAWRPEPTKWAIAENMAHLVVTNERYIPMLDSAIQKARDRGLTGEPPYRYNWLSRFAAAQSEPPVKRKFKAPKTFHPPSDEPIPAVELLPRFVASHDQFAVLMEQADGLDLGRAKVPSPVSSLLRFSLGGLWQLLAAHNRRHLWTIAQIKQKPGYPQS